MDLILFGIQGSGKGTQSQLIANRYNLKIFETGGQLRELAKEDSPLGKKVKSIIDRGELVPSQVVMEIVANFLEKTSHQSAILFDGLPRSNEQNVLFSQLMAKNNRDYQGLTINISQEEAIKRLSARRMCGNCKHIYPADYQKDICEKCGRPLITRNDDNLESIKTRLATYAKETIPVIDNYRQAGKMIDIDGQKPIDQVSNDIFLILDKTYNKNH